jgi:pimeloyl-ACP methyl ester carboxylesterase
MAVDAKGELGAGQYVEAGGVKTWFDAWGSGSPLVLMHGDLVGNGPWEPMVPSLAERFRVLAPERRSHGHTPDIEGDLTYWLLAEDMIAFLETVAGEPVHMVGWSGGGTVAIIVASLRPDLVRKLVAISASFDNESAVEPESVEELKSMTADGPEAAFMRAMYEAASPDGPAHWPVAFEKIKRMIMEHNPPITPEDLGRITAPTLVVAADDDLIRPEHTIELYRGIPNAQLAIVPGTSHMLVMEKPGMVGDLVLDFLQGDPVPTMMPIRRA